MQGKMVVTCRKSIPGSMIDAAMASLAMFSKGKRDANGSVYTQPATAATARTGNKTIFHERAGDVG